MKSEPLSCSRELLRQSLDDSLSELQEERLARHLSECSACQRELERLAAEQAEWSRVGSILKEEAQGGPCDSRDETPLAASGRDSAGDTRADSVVDLAVDFQDPSTDSQTLGRLGEIDILGVIGRGGMGIVLKGFQPELNRPVAVKVLAPQLATSGAARKRFAREAQATAGIVHPNVMPILAVNSSGKLPYLVMPYVVCESLQHRLDREGPMDTVEVLRIAVQVSKGLAAAHAQGLVHRDVKPANILLENGVDRVMLTDFGLARAVDDATLTRTGVIAGTPQYMSPEQARGESIDARSDLFSLGSVLYAMCTGRPPFRAESSYGILRRITDTEPRGVREINPDVPDWLAVIVKKVLAKRPDERFASADEVATLLEQCLAHVRQPTVVSLPETVRSLARQAQQPAGNRDRVSLSWRLALPIVLTAGIVTIAVVSWPAIGKLWSVKTSDTEQLAPAKEATGTNGHRRGDAPVTGVSSDADPSDESELSTTDAPVAGRPIPGTGTPSELRGEWPGFRGANRDGISPEETRLARSWPHEGPPVLWSVGMGEGYAGAAIGRGRVHVLDYDTERGADTARCLSLDDGREIWRNSYPVSIRPNHGITRTVPALAGDRVITMGPRCHLACWDAATGKCHWLIDLAREYETTEPPWYTGQCPLVDEQKVIVAPCGSALMIAIDYTTGKVVWKSANPHGWTMSHGSLVPIECKGRRCYVYGASGGAVGVAADDGMILWECTDWPVHFANCPSPVVLPNGQVFLSSGYGTSAGSLMLQLEASDGQILAKTVFELSSREFGSEIHTPIFRDGHLYGARKWGRGQMVCLDVSGKELWNSGGDSFGLGPYLFADGLLLALHEDGILTLAEASPAGYKRLASHPVIPDANEAWGPMAIAGGRLILRDLSRMVCVDLRSR